MEGLIAVQNKCESWQQKAMNSIGLGVRVEDGTRESFYMFVFIIQDTCIEDKFFLKLFIYLFMAVLGLRFCARAFSSCGKWGPLFIAVRGPLTIAAPPVAGHRLQMRRLSSCGSRA